MKEIATEYDRVFGRVDSMNVTGRDEERFALERGVEITSIEIYLLDYNARALLVNVFAHLVEELHADKLFSLVLGKGVDVRLRWRYDVEDLRCEV